MIFFPLTFQWSQGSWFHLKTTIKSKWQYDWWKMLVYVWEAVGCHHFLKASKSLSDGCQWLSFFFFLQWLPSKDGAVHILMCLRPNSNGCFRKRIKFWHYWDELKILMWSSWYNKIHQCWKNRNNQCMAFKNSVSHI